MYHHRASLGPVDVAFTNRLGGVSVAPFDSLDLTRGEGADRAENWRRVLADFAPGDELVDLQQVHGREVLVVTGADDGGGCADGLVTSTPGVVLAVRAADCVPVLLADPAAGVIGAVHSGRPGLAVGVVTAAVAAMRDLGADDIRAWVGPHVCGGCYEVPEQMQDEVAAVVPASRARTTWDTPSLDLGAGVTAQLQADGVVVVDVATCTRESPDLYSYRRDGARSGRLAGLIRLRS